MHSKVCHIVNVGSRDEVMKAAWNQPTRGSYLASGLIPDRSNRSNTDSNAQLPDKIAFYDNIPLATHWDLPCTARIVDGGKSEDVS